MQIALKIIGGAIFLFCISFFAIIAWALIGGCFLWLFERKGLHQKIEFYEAAIGKTDKALDRTLELYKKHLSHGNPDEAIDDLTTYAIALAYENNLYAKTKELHDELNTFRVKILLMLLGTYRKRIKQANEDFKLLQFAHFDHPTLNSIFDKTFSH